MRCSRCNKPYTTLTTVIGKKPVCSECRKRLEHSEPQRSSGSPSDTPAIDPLAVAIALSRSDDDPPPATPDVPATTDSTWPAADAPAADAPAVESGFGGGGASGSYEPAPADTTTSFDVPSSSMPDP